MGALPPRLHKALDDISPKEDTQPEISHGFVWNRATRRALLFKHDKVNGRNKLRQH